MSIIFMKIVSILCLPKPSRPLRFCPPSLLGLPTPSTLVRPPAILPALPPRRSIRPAVRDSLLLLARSKASGASSASAARAVHPLGWVLEGAPVALPIRGALPRLSVPLLLPGLDRILARLLEALVARRVLSQPGASVHHVRWTVFQQLNITVKHFHDDIHCEAITDNEYPPTSIRTLRYVSSLTKSSVYR